MLYSAHHKVLSTPQVSFEGAIRSAYKVGICITLLSILSVTYPFPISSLPGLLIPPLS